MSEVGLPWDIIVADLYNVGLGDFEQRFHPPFKVPLRFRPFPVLGSLYGVIMRFLVIAFSVFLLVGLQQQNKKSRATQQSPRTDQRGTESMPLVVRIKPAPKTDEEAAQDKKDREEKTTNDRNLIDLTAILALVGALQLLVFGYQALKLRETVKSAGEQSEAMERHIVEAARSATAMEQIANTIEAGNQAVMRAYLTVSIGTALYQERRGPGQTDLKFEGRPNLLNTGNTPARKVRIRTAADILPIPIPETFQFSLPDESEIKDAGIVGAHQTYILAGTVKDFVPDSEVAVIKEGSRKALCVWGLITYEDIFGVNHKTRFAQWLTWYPNGTVFGYYIPGQNDAD